MTRLMKIAVVSLAVAAGATSANAADYSDAPKTADAVFEQIVRDGR